MSTVDACARYVMLIAVVATALPAAAQTRSRAAATAAVDSIVARALQGGKAAGMSVGVVQGRDTLVLKGYGFADLEFDVPTPDRAVYEIGSVTKQFTASSILLLQERGQLSLDDPITKYLPSYPTQGHVITIRRLLDHTSGIKGYTELPEFGNFMRRHEPRDSLVALFSTKPFDFESGDDMIYNNSAYFLLGLIIEKVSGMPYADFVQKNLFDKAGMSDSRYCSENAIVKRRAHGYDMSATGLVRAAYLDHLWPYAAGSLCSTAGDLVAWNRALHGGKILSPASYREITTPGTLNDGSRLRYAKGLAVHELAGHRVIEHGGGINGFLSSSNYLPDDDAIIVVLVNSAGPVAPDAIAGQIAEAVFGAKAPGSQAFSGDLSKFAGTYGGAGRGRPMTLTIGADSGKLTVLTVGPGGSTPRAARYVGDDTFQIGETRYAFVTESGRVTGLRVDGVYGYSHLKRQ
ncbi:MAG: serine hydrolase domain-containing protein [Gemmatimonadaceae bacterium]